MIHVCFPLYDAKGTYSKYEGVAICSLLENTQEDVTIHLIHDDTLTQENRKKFYDLVHHYGGKIFFYAINSNNLMEKTIVRSFTVGTLFRLKMADVLSTDIRKVIYLDADLIVNLDIAELWRLDLKGNVIGARKDAIGERWLCNVGMVPANQYFNAGVMLIDLAKIRTYKNFAKQCMSFLDKYPQCEFLDQDAMNYICKNKVLFLDKKYNEFTIELRHAINSQKPCIYHFAGDFVNIDQLQPFDKLFFRYLFKTPWVRDGIGYFEKIVNLRKIQLTLYRKILYKICIGSKKIMWGAKGRLYKTILDIVPISRGKDYIVDNDTTLQGQSLNNIEIYSPKKIISEVKGKFIVIVISRGCYSEIKQQLISYDLVENEDFFDGRLLLMQDQGGYVDYY